MTHTSEELTEQEQQIVRSLLKHYGVRALLNLLAKEFATLTLQPSAGAYVKCVWHLTALLLHQTVKKLEFIQEGPCSTIN